MKKIFLAILALLVLAFVAYSVSKGVSAPAVSNEPAGTMKTYSSERYGVTFSYPDTYYLEERLVNSGQRERFQIILTEDTEWNRKLRVGDVPATEGPTAITIDVFQNNLDSQSEHAFVTSSSDSNYKLGDGRFSTSTRGALTGLEYTWSGLYEGRSFVVSRPNYLYMFSVTRLDPTDKILRDFNDIIETAKIR